MTSKFSVLVYICLLLSLACKPRNISDLDHCLAQSGIVVTDANTNLNELIKVQVIKNGRIRVKRLLKVYESKDNISKQMESFFDLKGYQKMINPIDTLIFNYPRSKELIWEEIDLVGSDSILAPLLNKDKDTVLYKQIINLNKFKVKSYLASWISSYDYSFDKIFGVAVSISSDTMQLGLATSKISNICDIDSLQLDGRNLLPENYQLNSTLYYVPYDFYFSPYDNVELEIVIDGLTGVTVFPFKYKGH